MTHTTQTANNEIKVLLESGEMKVNFETKGLKGADSIAKQLIELFLEGLEKEGTEGDSKADVMEEMKKAYEEVGQISSKESVESDVEEPKAKENWTKPVDNMIYKYKKEFPKLQDALSRNLYNKLSELQLNQQSYFVTDKGVLRLQARYSCTCGNFKKHWVSYPHGSKIVRCSNCSKENKLVPVKGTFPCTDDFGNYYVTSNMIKYKERTMQ